MVTRVRLDPRAGVIGLTISDGAATLAAQWPIRPPAALLRAVPGSGLILEGVARIGPSSGLLMVEPTFEVMPGPEQR